MVNLFFLPKKDSSCSYKINVEQNCYLSVLFGSHIVWCFSDSQIDSWSLRIWWVGTSVPVCILCHPLSLVSWRIATETWSAVVYT